MRFRALTLILTVSLFSAKITGQNIGINEDGSTPNSSAILDIKANNKGLLIPRLTTSQRNAISSPAEGLLVYDTQLDQVMYWDSGSWHSVSDDGQWEESGADVYRVNGDVGIGTSNPLAKLHLYRDDLGQVSTLYQGQISATSSTYRTSTNNNGVSLNSSSAASWTGAPNAAAGSGGAFWTGGFVGNNERSDYLDITFTSFNAAIPTTATVQGVVISIYRRASDTNDIEDFLIQLKRNGSAIGQNKANNTPWPQNISTATYGGTADLWGVGGLTPAIINAGGLGVRIQYEGDTFWSNDERGYVDFVRAQVYYSNGANLNNTYWSVGTVNGEFAIDNSTSLVSSNPLQIDQAGVTELTGLRIPSGAVTGRVLTSAADGRATWQNLPTDQVNDGDFSPSNEIQSISKSGMTVTLSNGGGSFIDAVDDSDSSPSNEIQTLSKSGNVVSLSMGGGTFTDAVDDADASPTNEIQTINKSGSIVSLSNGGGSFTDAVDDADSSPTNEIQDLSLSGNTLSLSGDGSTVDLSSFANDDDWVVGFDDMHSNGKKVRVNTNLSSDYDFIVSGDSYLVGSHLFAGPAKFKGASVGDQIEIEVYGAGYNISDDLPDVVFSRAESGTGVTEPITTLDYTLGKISFRGQTNTVTNGSGVNPIYQTASQITSDPKSDFSSSASADLVFWTKASGGVLSERMTISPEGNVGIGMTPTTYTLELPNNAASGDAIAHTWNTYSDARIKRNIQPLDLGLEAILNIRPKIYDQHDSEFKNGELILDQDNSKQNLGFIAQELLEVVPEAVVIPSEPESELYSVDYTRLIPVLTKAIQEQQEMIEALRKEVEQLKLKE